jgi:hypothetical protein
MYTQDTVEKILGEVPIMVKVCKLYYGETKLLFDEWTMMFV